MWPIVTDQWSVGLSVTLVSPAKMAAPIEMPFGLRGPAVEDRSLADVLSLSCARLVADG